MSRYKSESQCPLCGKDNHCNVAGDCWCGKESFPEEIFTIIPEQQQRKACICINCLNEFKKNSAEINQQN